MINSCVYCRIRKEHQFDMFKEDNKYFGIGNFVAETLNFTQLNQGLHHQESASNKLEPGTFEDDGDYEDMVCSGSDGSLKAYIQSKNITSEGEIEKMQRFIGLLFLYMGAIIRKAGIYEKIPGILGEFLHMMSEESTTAKVMKEIDNFEDETGYMVLIRILSGVSGHFFVKVLRKLRDILGMSTKFSILIDIDGKTEERQLCEKQFYSRIRRWQGHNGFNVRNYADLKNLPVLLVVVEKGKMGITYPKSLRYYDLRMRYARMGPNTTTRSAIEQDFGRACRWKSDDDPPLPTVLLSHPAKEQLLKNIRRTRNLNRKYHTSGIHLLSPDYSTKMRLPARSARENKEMEHEDEDEVEDEPNVPSSGKGFPRDDNDLKPYRHWWAGKEHCDHKNTEAEKDKNRFLLYGRPQLGKTGVFLQLTYLLWCLVGKPPHTSPINEKREAVEIEEESESESGTDLDDADDLTRNNLEKFPDFEIVKKQTMKKPSVSARYGDPNNPEVLEHYRQGHNFPHFSVLVESNKLLARNSQPSSSKDPQIQRQIKPDTTRKNDVPKTILYNKYQSKPLTLRDGHFDESNYYKIPMTLKKNKVPIYQPFGCLYINKKQKTEKMWNMGEWTVKSDLPHPPILIPSSGRWNTALLDLSEAMEENMNYVQIVIIRDGEKQEYMKHFHGFEMISFFVMDANIPATVGAARFVAKKLAARITHDSSINWMMMLDDNIVCWDGVTLINDPCPQFLPPEEVLHNRSQITHTSLFQLLTTFCNKNLETNLKNFDVVGFSMMNPRNVTRRSNAFRRSHVFAAVLQNMKKLKEIDYNKNMWACEDVCFNKRVNELSYVSENKGIIVKCLRYIATKKVIKDGGVVPQNVPENLIGKIQENKHWSHAKVINQRGEKSKVVSKDHPDFDDISNVENPAEESSNAIEGRKSSSGDRGYTVKAIDIVDIMNSPAPGSKSSKMLEEAIFANIDPAILAKICEQRQEEDAEKRRQKEYAGSEGLPSTSDNEIHAKATNSKLEQGGKKRSNRTTKKTPPHDSKYRKISDYFRPK